MIAIDNLPSLRRAVIEIRRKRDEAKGAYRQSLAGLEKEFGVKSLKALRKLLPELEARELKASRLYAAEKKKFERQYRKQLREIGYDPKERYA